MEKDPSVGEDGGPMSIQLEVTGDTSFCVLKGFTYRDRENHPHSVPARTPTDLASVPAVFQWLVRSYGKHTAAAIVHDVEWFDDADRPTLRTANRVFREAMWDSKVPFVRRWLMWTAVTMPVFAKGRIGVVRALIWALGLAIVLGSAIATPARALTWRSAVLTLGAAAIALVLGFLLLRFATSKAIKRYGQVGLAVGAVVLLALFTSW